MNNKRRLFIAIPVPEELKTKLAETAERHSFPGKLVPPANLHITVDFLGSVEAAAIEGLVETLEKATRNIDPFQMNFTGFKIKKGFRSMIWGVFEHSDNFKLLAVKIKNAVESKDYRISPHITISRIKGKETLTNIPELQFKFTVYSFELWESKPGGQTARYESLVTFPLKQVWY